MPFNAINKVKNIAAITRDEYIYYSHGLEEHN
jgi:hypothetical protein